MSVKVINVKEDILGANDEKAKTNRELLDKHHITFHHHFNLMEVFPKIIQLKR